MLVFMMFRIFIVFAFIFFNVPAFSQGFFRIKSDFQIKTKTPDGKFQLTNGKVYYDKGVKQIVFEIFFPERETWIQKDTLLYKIVNSRVESKQSVPNIIEFTIYHLALSGNLADYGLRNTNFNLKNVEKTGSGIITTWEPPKDMKELFGDVLMLNSGQELSGIVFKNTDGDVVSRQFFRNYQRVRGLSFPQEIIKENYINGVIQYEITIYSNIIVNDYSEDKYSLRIPQSDK